MAFIGNTVQNQGFTPAIDYFNGNGVTVTFTLSRPIASVAQVIVAVDNVIQNPSSAFNVVGNSITFTSAPLSGTNNIWVEYTSLITTYQGISQDPTVIGDIRATGGYLAEGDFGNSFIDGNLIDYVTGRGRFTVGELDDITFYHGGTSGRSEMMDLYHAGGAKIYGTTALTIPVGTTAERPTGATGMIRMNTTTGNPEWYSSTASSWVNFGDGLPYSVNYLVVAGGGGAGSGYGGAGGAGGYRTSTLSVTAGVANTVTVGAGGAAGTGVAGSATSGSNGSNSVFSSITSTGGGGGGGNQTGDINGKGGGSGGGAGMFGGAGSAGAGTAGQGNNGGASVDAGTVGGNSGGGGGGAGAVGGNASSGVGGTGGVGLSSSISGSSVFYAGGGGGGSGTTPGAGGNGGGGNGTVGGTAGSGTPNTGGGGGSFCQASGTAGSGGSGIVIISYAGAQRGTGGTVTSSGGNTIHTFTSSGTFIA